MSLQFGIVLALLCAFASNLAFLCKHRGACAACAVNIRHPVRTAVSLWSQRWFALGMLIGLLAWVMHVGAISLAPLSVVQVVLSSGLVLLAVMADRLFGFKVAGRQWWGLALTCIGLVLLAITLPASSGEDHAYSVSAMVAFETGLFGLGALCIMGPRLGGRREHHGIMLAAAAGILFGVCNLGVKALTGIVGHGAAQDLFASPWLWVTLLGSATAFYASARSLQTGGAVAVIAITGTAANIATIAGGIIVFGDPLPGDTLGIVVQAVAFVLVIVASALTPAPVRAAGRRSSEPAHASA